MRKLDDEFKKVCFPPLWRLVLFQVHRDVYNEVCHYREIDGLTRSGCVCKIYHNKTIFVFMRLWGLLYHQQQSSAINIVTPGDIALPLWQCVFLWSYPLMIGAWPRISKYTLMVFRLTTLVIVLTIYRTQEKLRRTQPTRSVHPLRSYTVLFN